MAYFLGILFLILSTIAFFSVSSDNIIYSVSYVVCISGSTCPQGNPTIFNQTYALNGTISPNITLNVGDRLEFDLITNVTIHPLTICKNSSIPNFCQGVSDDNKLNTPITLAGTSTSVNFTIAGTYFYGCLNHRGMGAIINVVQTTTATSASITSISSSLTTTTTTKSNNGYRLSASFLFIGLMIIFSIIFI